MTEAEWREGGRHGPMLAHLGARASERRLRLFACACCRRIWPLFRERGSRAAVEALERFADFPRLGGESEDAVQSAAYGAGLRARERWETARTAQRTHEQAGSLTGAGWWEREEAVKAAAHREAAAWLAWSLSRRRGELVKRRVWTAAEAATAAASFAVAAAQERDAEEAERRALAALVRELFGNPFRPVVLDPSWLAWRDGAVKKMAQVVYDERRFGDLPILADALEDAGCDDGEILAHCRGGGEHVRGCWVVDLLLGRE